MTDAELDAKRRQLRDKAETLASVPPMVAAGQAKAAALMMAEITEELTRRELARQGGRHE